MCWSGVLYRFGGMRPFLKTPKMKKIAILILSLICVSAFAQRESKWVELQCIDIPQGAALQQGTTSSGNAKYWFEFDQIGKVSVSPGSAEKYKSGEAVLQLVKWQHKETKDYKYSIRQKKGHKQTKNIDLLTIFKR